MNAAAKKWVKALSLLLLLTGCDCAPHISEQESNLPGNHDLRQMFTRDKVSSSPGSMGGFFLFGIGGMSGSSGETKVERVVTFAWKNPKNEYIISTFPIEKIRVSFDSSLKTPYVKFCWRSGASYNRDLEDRIIYIVVVCRENQWPEKIEMPNLENKLS